MAAPSRRAQGASACRGRGLSERRRPRTQSALSLGGPQGAQPVRRRPSRRGPSPRRPRPGSPSRRARSCSRSRAPATARMSATPSNLRSSCAAARPFDELQADDTAARRSGRRRSEAGTRNDGLLAPQMGSRAHPHARVRLLARYHKAMGGRPVAALEIDELSAERLVARVTFEDAAYSPRGDGRRPDRLFTLVDTMAYFVTISRSPERLQARTSSVSMEFLRPEPVAALLVERYEPPRFYVFPVLAADRRSRRRGHRSSVRKTIVCRFVDTADLDVAGVERSWSLMHVVSLRADSSPDYRPPRVARLDQSRDHAGDGRFQSSIPVRPAFQAVTIRIASSGRQRLRASAQAAGTTPSLTRGAPT